MSKENYNKGSEKTINKSYFRGDVRMIEVLNKDNSEQYEMYHVFFKKRAITTIHSHKTEQILIATKGKGIVCLIKENFLDKITPEKVMIMEVGDVVSIPANVFHFHGSFSNDGFSHIAFRNRKLLNTEGKILDAGNIWEIDLLKELFNNDEKKIKETTQKIDQEILELLNSSTNNVERYL